MSNGKIHKFGSKKIPLFNGREWTGTCTGCGKRAELRPYGAPDSRGYPTSICFECGKKNPAMTGMMIQAELIRRGRGMNDLNDLEGKNVVTLE